MLGENAASAPLIIRTFRPSSDAPKLREILRESPEAAQWAADDYAGTQNSGLGHILVSEAPGEIVGFLCARQVADEAEILNVAIRGAWRRRGAGSHLLLGALERLRSNQVTRIFLEVRESNRAAIALYSKHGFAETGRRAGYYQDPAEAAILMEKKLTG